MFMLPIAILFYLSIPTAFFAEGEILWGLTFAVLIPLVAIYKLGRAMA